VKAPSRGDRDVCLDRHQMLEDTSGRYLDQRHPVQSSLVSGHHRPPRNMCTVVLKPPRGSRVIPNSISSAVVLTFDEPAKAMVSASCHKGDRHDIGYGEKSRGRGLRPLRIVSRQDSLRPLAKALPIALLKPSWRSRKRMAPREEGRVRPSP
jgi:hypothetical protein